MNDWSYRLVGSARETNLSERFFGRFARIGLRGVLADTNRVAIPTDVPGDAAVEGMTWQRSDRETRRWFPQGITTSADAYGPVPTGESLDGRPVVIVSWYAHGVLAFLLGSRISVIDIGSIGPGAPQAPRYRHVLLVDPERRRGIHRLRPVRVHAGGIVWYGKYLYVAGTKAGIRVFRLDDIVRVRNRFRTKGYRYVLPQFTSYTAQSNDGVDPMRYSFLSLDRAGDEDHLVAGEYGRKVGSHRLARYPIDRRTQLLRSDDRGRAVPAHLHDKQIARMQGATLVDGTWFVTASTGEGNPGDLWVGRPDDFTRHRGVLPTGPEDITYWPQRRQLWSVTEWPGSRWVYAIDVDKWVSATDEDVS